MKNIFKILIVGVLHLNLYGVNISQNQCTKQGKNFIYVNKECIKIYESIGDNKNAITIVMHGTWPKHVNILSRYAIFAQDLSMQTDITTIAVALPGYSKSSSNNIKPLYHKKAKEKSNIKKYTNFLSQLVYTLKKKYNAKIVNYIGHSASATMGARLATTSLSLIDNFILVGGKYNIDIKTLNKDANYILVYGTKDKISKPAITKKFYKNMKQNNFNVDIIKVKDGIHLDLDMTDECVNAITKLLQDQ
jgi:predicted esterase